MNFVYSFGVVKKKYQHLIRDILRKHFPGSSRIFIFGSSLGGDSYSDIDVGVDRVGERSESFYAAKDELEESTIPYYVDIVNFDLADVDFRKEVFSDKVLWLTSKRN